MAGTVLTPLEAAAHGGTISHAGIGAEEAVYTDDGHFSSGKFVT